MNDPIIVGLIIGAVVVVALIAVLKGGTFAARRGNTSFKASGKAGPSVEGVEAGRDAVAIAVGREARVKGVKGGRDALGVAHEK